MLKKKESFPYYNETILVVFISEFKWTWLHKVPFYTLIGMCQYLPNPNHYHTLSEKLDFLNSFMDRYFGYINGLLISNFSGGDKEHYFGAKSKNHQ